MAVRLSEIAAFLDGELDIRGIEDSSRNGLQVEGPDRVSVAALAVDACMESFEAARAAGAELLIVHHGLFWSDFSGLRGADFRRVRFLVENGMGLYAAHLPLDRHPVIGHNALLFKMLGLRARKEFAFVKGKPIGYWGRFAKPKRLAEIVSTLAEKIGGEPKVIRAGKGLVKTVGIVSGGGGADFREAAELGLDCYVTGETSYLVFHKALESGVSVVFAGHYNTETPGMLGLGRVLEKKFGLKTVFVDVPGPSY